MATKNLARTIVEGGRSTYSKLDRRERNRRERRFRFDIDGNLVSGKVRRTGGRDFADRLAPLERWLSRQVGRGWSNIYREFCERFDRRSMKGWHLDDHLRQMVGRGRFPWGASFLIDARGILRRRPPRSWGRRSMVPPTDKTRVLEWAAGRQVIVRGDVAFWTAWAIDSLVPTSARDGERHGTTYRIDAPGRLVSATPYSRGHEHGIARQWADDGRLLGTYRMHHGTGIDLWWLETWRRPRRRYLAEVHFMRRGLCHRFEWWINDDQRSVYLGAGRRG